MSDEQGLEKDKQPMESKDFDNSALLEFSTEGVAILAKDGKFKAATASACFLLRYSVDEIANIELHKIVHSLDANSLKQIFQSAVMRSGMVEIAPFRLSCKNGDFRWFQGHFINKLDDLAINGIVFRFSIAVETAVVENNLADFPEKNSVESELFNKNILSALNDQIAVVANDGTILAVNKAWEEFAVNVGELELHTNSVGSNYFSVCEAAINQGDYEVKKIMDGILSVFDKSAASFHQEYPCITSKVYKWFLMNVLPFGEDVTKVVITHQDITKRKFAEENLGVTTEKLKSTLSELSAILHSSLDIICTVNAEMEFVTLNNAVFTVLGYKAEELVGTKFTNLVHPDDIASTILAARQIFKGFPLQLSENRYIHKNGKIVSLLWSVNWDNKAGMMYAVAKDVTERNKMVKAIESERNQFYEMFSKAPSAIGMLRGPNHIFEMVNPLYLQLINKSDIIGKTVLEVLPEVEEQGFIQMLDDVYRNGESYKNTEQLVQIYSKEDKKMIDFYISFLYQPYRDENGIIDGVFFFINNITEQLTTKQKISKSEKFFKGVIENSQDMVATVNEEGVVLYASPAVSKTYGYPIEEILKINIFEVIHPDDKQLSIDFISKILQKPATPMSCPAIRQRINTGTYIWVEATLTNFLETEGINAIVVNFRDISARKNAEFILSQTLDELETERARLLTAQKVAKIGSWVTDATTLKAMWSDETFHILGADPKYFEASYEKFLSFVHPDDLEFVTTNFLATIDGKGSNIIEHRIITSQGIEKWVEERWTISEDDCGGKSIAVGTCQDITARKEAEGKVIKSETKLKIAQHIAHVGSWEIDIARDEHTWSDELYRILEISENTLPSNASFIAAIHPEDREMVNSNISKSLESGEDSSFHFRFLRKNGTTGYALTEWKTEKDSMGKAVHMYGILRDLTKQKKDEDERQKMIVDIIQRNKDLEQFSYIISHNLRSPVANIIGLTAELSDYTHSAETVFMLKEAISNDVKRLEEVIVDLNSIVQTKRDIMEQKEEVELDTLVKSIKLSINYLIENQGISIATNFSQINSIHTIKSYLQSIFYNLISNSIKYRSPDRDLILQIYTEVLEDSFLIVFRDNGSGIDLAKIGSQLFGLYKRFHAGTEGKGLGLYMVKTQVETLGGKIDAESTVGVGTTFTIEFPNVTLK